METFKRIIAIPTTGHPTIKAVYVLQILVPDTEVPLVNTNITQGEFELLNEQNCLEEYFPVDFSKFPIGYLPIAKYYKIK